MYGYRHTDTHTHTYINTHTHTHWDRYHQYYWSTIHRKHIHTHTLTHTHTHTHAHTRTHIYICTHTWRQTTSASYPRNSSKIRSFRYGHLRHLTFAYLICSWVAQVGSKRWAVHVATNYWSNQILCECVFVCVRAHARELVGVCLCLGACVSWPFSNKAENVPMLVCQRLLWPQHIVADNFHRLPLSPTIPHWAKYSLLLLASYSISRARSGPQTNVHERATSQQRRWCNGFS